MKREQPLWIIYRAPVTLGVGALAGLVIALLGDGFWNALAWALAAAPGVAIGRAVFRARLVH